MVEKGKGKKILRKFLRIVGWLMISMLLLLILVIVAVQLPPVQNSLTQKAVGFLEKKLGTKVSLDHINISFPKTIILEGLYFEDQNKDTLLYAGRFSINTDLFALASRKIELNEIGLENGRAYVNRPETDSAYNFSYILKAFAGDSTATPDTLEEKGWKISVERIDLENIIARYHDYLTGNLVDLDLGELEVSISEFDLDKMKIVVDEINLSDTRTAVVQTKQPEVTEEVAEEQQPFTYDIGVAKITLENIHGSFTQEALGKMIRLDLEKSELVTDKIDLKANRIDLRKFSLMNSFLSLQQRKPPSAAPAKTYDPEPVREKIAEESTPWIITLNELELDGNSLQYYDFTKPHAKGSVDFDHLWLTSLMINARDLIIEGTAVKCNLQNLSFREKSGFIINRFSTLVDFDDQKLNISDLRLATGNSRIQIQANALSPSFANIAQNYPQTRFRAKLHNTTISLRDILYFNPTLRDSLPINLPLYSKLVLDGSMNGSVGDINIEHFTARAFSDTYLKTHGKIAGLPKTENVQLNLTVDKLHTTKKDLDVILVDTLIPESIGIPEWITLQAKYDGSLKKSGFSAQLSSSLGAADLSGKMNLDSASAARGYEAALIIKDLDAGMLLKKPDTLGKLNAEAYTNIHGLAFHELTGEIHLLVKEFEYYQYRYENFKVDANILNGIYTGTASLKDENLDFLLNGSLDYSDEVPRYAMNLDVKNANFKALGLAERPLKARGILVTDIATDDFKRLNGTVGLRKVAIFNGEALYAVDSLLFASLDEIGKSELKIESDLLSGYFEGSFNVLSTADVLKEYLNTYYSLHDSTLVPKKDAPPQHFNFHLQLKKTELLTDIIIPELESFVPGEIKGEFNSEKKQLDLQIDIHQIVYSKIGVKSFILSTTSDRSALNYNILADEITIDSLKIDGVEFSGTVANDSINTSLVILDSSDRQKYILGGIFKSLADEYQFTFLPDRVRLNYVDWSVNPDNYLRFGGEKMLAKDIELSNIRERIIIDSKDDAASTLFIGFRELNLEYLVSMVNREKAASGLLHGDIFVVPDTSRMTFTADIGIKDFNLSEIPWGDVALSVKHATPSRFDVLFSISSRANDLRLNGYYIAGVDPLIDLNAAIRKFNLTSVEPLTMGQTKDLKGSLTGGFRIQGSMAKPLIDGALNFDSVSFFSTYLKTPFSVDNETISLTRNGIVFDHFTLLDNRKNKGAIDGIIRTTDYSNFAFDLDITTNNFRLLNTTEKDNELFYGRIDVDANIAVRGEMNEPAVTMQVALGPSSHLTYVVPQSEAGVMEAEGIVRFVDKTFKGDPFMQNINPEDTVKSQFRGLHLTARIELTDRETFTIIIDPTTGDQLTVRGNTTMTLNMDPTGDMDLTGRYEITEGTYNLSFYKFVKREFKIEKGSTMIWEGDPLNADMDINAIYDVETAPIDLFGSQAQGEPETVLSRYKQRLPFHVFMNIKGELLKPEISFRLDMPEGERDYADGNVYSRLMDINTRESDLNKQVFALLILKRFISDNPFESQASGSIEETARTSVSKLLTDQLNRLSENIRGVELSFDVKSYEDYSSGSGQGQTQLQLGLSKNLFNDRLVVKVAGNVGLEGESTGGDVTDYIGDIALEYKLTHDGRFRITGFRNSNYDMIDGELTETGTGLIYVKDYNLLGELFKPNAKNKKH